MDDQVILDIQRRLQWIERNMVRLRLGEVTDPSPLDIALGGADVSYEDVAAVTGAGLKDGEQVAALLAGNDILALGALGGSRVHAQAGATNPGATITSTANPPTVVVSDMAISADLGTKPVLIGFTGSFQNSVVGDVRILLYDNTAGAAIGTIRRGSVLANNGVITLAHMAVYTPPASGSRTIQVRASTTAGNLIPLTTERQLVIVELG